MRDPRIPQKYFCIEGFITAVQFLPDNMWSVREFCSGEVFDREQEDQYELVIVADDMQSAKIKDWVIFIHDREIFMTVTDAQFYEMNPKWISPIDKAH
jgi:hypothetical protein